MNPIRHPNRAVASAAGATARGFSRAHFLRALQQRVEARQALREEEDALLAEAWERLDSYDEQLWADWDAGLARAQQRRQEELNG